MFDNLPPIFFYIPQKDWRDDFPQSSNVYWPGFSQGRYCWTVQTYLKLSEAGFPCQLVAQLPDEGIVLAHRDSLNFDLKPTHNLFLVCLKADQEAHPYAQFHIVQNPLETRTLKASAYVPHWPQPGLLPRDCTRGTQVENIAFFGISYNLASELKDPAWGDRLKELGFRWIIQPQERWHDYRNVDVVLAVRSFEVTSDFSFKPATKLYNAWHAGVPAILGPESAFQQERKSELDYIEITTAEAAIAALTRLRDYPDLYQGMIDRGRSRALETSSEALVKRWQSILSEDIRPHYFSWKRLSPQQRSAYISQQFLKMKIKALKRRFDRLIGNS